jgi:hypothetical protein
MLNALNTDQLLQWFPWAAIAVALFHQVWRRFKRRMITLRWTHSYQIIAVSANDPVVGTIQIIRNERPVLNVMMCHLQITNDSNKDVTNLILDVGFNDGTIILAESGSVNGVPRNTVFYTEAFTADAARIMQVPEEQRQQHPEFTRLNSNRQYRVPVLNRYSVCDLELTVQRQPVLALQREIMVNCNHEGLLLVPERHPIIQLYKLFGVPYRKAVIVGMIVGVLISFALAWWSLNIAFGVFFAFLVGASAAVLGAFVLKCWRVVINILG